MHMASDPEKDAALGNDALPPISAQDPNARPECFKSTLQECLFVTMAVAMSSFLTGAITVMSSFAGRDLGMSNAEITWMNAASSYVTSTALSLNTNTTKLTIHLASQRDRCF
jgi:hypothetical protein